MIKELVTKLCEYRRDLISGGYDAALELLCEYNPAIKVHEYPTGTQVWDWIIPPKWECSRGWIQTPGGKTLLDTSNHPLHVMSYSLPIEATVGYKELSEHLHTNPAVPSGIPFEYAYYEQAWGFCVQHESLVHFDSAEYKVHIDSEFSEGTLKVGELFLPGTTDEEIVLTAHLCHPFQANDNASGVAALMSIAEKLDTIKHRYGYRILIVPETIGSIAYLAHNEELIPRIKYAIALDMLGTPDTPLVLQHTRQGNTQIDKAAELALLNVDHEITGFAAVIGNDEKVLNARGVDIPSISLARTECEGIFYGYHTSIDNPESLNYDAIDRAVDVVIDILRILDTNTTPLCTVKGHPQLSRHGLWVDHRTDKALHQKQMKVLDMLDGRHTLIDIAYALDLDVDVLKLWLDELTMKGLLNV